MGKICSVDDKYETDPAAYVVEMRKRTINQMLLQRVEVDNDDDDIDLDGMNQAEIREYYDKKVKKQLEKMDPLE